MLWVFERDGRHARLQVLYLAPEKTEVHFIDAEGVEHVEHFTNATAAGDRQLALQNELMEQGWSKLGEWKL